MIITVGTWLENVFTIITAQIYKNIAPKVTNFQFLNAYGKRQKSIIVTY